MNFKVYQYDEIELLVDVVNELSRLMIPRGTRGTVVECYEEPIEGYAVDLAIPDESLVGGYRYVNVVLLPEQFDVKNSES